ncbi:MAG: YjgP/YjgQ family permease [Fibrobacter sp.]|nr:YjgP/YjgQ family permease [Fibrobacter sp.]
MNEELAPWATQKSQDILRYEIFKEALPGFEERVYFRDPGNRFYYVGAINLHTGTLDQIMVYEPENEKKQAHLITAQKGSFTEDTWYLSEGVLVDFDDEGYPSHHQSFAKYELHVGTNIEKFISNQHSSQEKSRKELKSDIMLYSQSGTSYSQLLVDYHIKLAFPISAFVFVIIGVPLGINYGKGRGLAVILSIILVFIYYVLVSFSRSLGRNDLLTPLLAAWLPNLLFLSLGLLIILREERFRL